jgi:hypothetical protein
MTTLDTTDIAQRLAAALDLHAQAKNAKPEDNPMVTRDLKDLVHGAGILKYADKLPQRDQYGWMGPGNLNHAVREGLESAKVDKSAKRMAVARARAARKRQFDEIAARPTPPRKDLTAAWYVVFPLVPIVTRIANSKRSWATRFLGSTVDDIPQMALEAMALVLAKGDYDMDVLRQAAEELGAVERTTKRVPADQLSEDERKERKKIAKARKWLMGLVNNRVMGALVDSYTSVNNLKWENLDIITSVIASISGVGDDPQVATSKADKAPAMLGSRFTEPGGINRDALATAISAAITDRRLDPLVELLLDDDNRRTDGAFKWAEHAEEVFMCLPDGQWKWDVVCEATKDLASPRRARADAARTLVRQEFDWLPSLIVSVINALDIQVVYRAYRDHRPVAVMATGLSERMNVKLDTERAAEGIRRPLRPALTYATTEEAALALVAHMDVAVADLNLVGV